MKKIFLMIFLLIFITGCGKEEYEYTCTKVDTGKSYKETTSLNFSFDKGLVYKFSSEIKEEHTSDESANDSYTNYQALYSNYNENNIISEYKKNKNVITATFLLDKADIDKMKVELPYDFKLTKAKFLSSLKDMGFSCKEK